MFKQRMVFLFLMGVGIMMPSSALANPSSVPSMEELAQKYPKIRYLLDHFEQYTFTRPISFREAEDIFSKAEIVKLEYIYAGGGGSYQLRNLPSGNYHVSRYDYKGPKTMLASMDGANAKTKKAIAEEVAKLNENTPLIHTILVVKGSTVKKTPYIRKEWERPSWVDDKYNEFYSKYHLR